MTLLKTGSAGENINSGQLMDVRLPKIKQPQQQKIMQQVKLVEAEARSLEEQLTNALAIAGNRLLERLGMLASIPSLEIDYYTRSVGLGRLDYEYNNPRYDIINMVIDGSKTEFVELMDAADFLQDSDNPTERPNMDFLYADIGNVDTKWGELNYVAMKGKDAKSSRMRRVMDEGSVLVSTTRPTRNAIAIVPKKLDKQICSTGFAVLKCKPIMNNRFLFHALRSWLSNLQFTKHCSGSGYPAINQETDLPHIRVPAPALIDDQVKIADEIDDLLSKARKIERESKHKRKVANAVFDKVIIKFVPLLGEVSEL